jgi:hypothetical protein
MFFLVLGILYIDAVYAFRPGYWRTPLHTDILGIQQMEKTIRNADGDEVFWFTQLADKGGHKDVIVVSCPMKNHKGDAFEESMLRLSYELDADAVVTSLDPIIASSVSPNVIIPPTSEVRKHLSQTKPKEGFWSRVVKPIKSATTLIQSFFSKQNIPSTEEHHGFQLHSDRPLAMAAYKICATLNTPVIAADLSKSQKFEKFFSAFVEYNVTSRLRHELSHDYGGEVDVGGDIMEVFDHDVAEKVIDLLDSPEHSRFVQKKLQSLCPRAFNSLQQQRASYLFNYTKRSQNKRTTLLLVEDTLMPYLTVLLLGAGFTQIEAHENPILRHMTAPTAASVVKKEPGQALNPIVGFFKDVADAVCEV